MEGEQKFAFISWRYSKNKNILVRCQLCGGTKMFSAAENSTSNLLKHLTGQHSTVKLLRKYRAQRAMPQLLLPGPVTVEVLQQNNTGWISPIEHQQTVEKV